MVRTLLFPFLLLVTFANPVFAKSRLRVLTENWPPMAYVEDGQKMGMAIELTQMLQQKIAKNSIAWSPIEILPFARAYNTALTRPNTLLFSVVRTPEREAAFRLLGPITNGEIQLFAKPQSPLNLQPEIMKTKLLIATVRGSIYETALQQQGFKNVILVSDPLTNIKLLMSGRVDLVCDDVLAIAELTRRAGYPSTELTKVHSLGLTTHYYAFSKGTLLSTIEVWKKALEEVKANGEFKALYAKWFKNVTPSLDVVLTNPELQKTTLKKDERPFGLANVK